jgi:hypothetical protein
MAVYPNFGLITFGGFYFLNRKLFCVHTRVFYSCEAFPQAIFLDGVIERIAQAGIQQHFPALILVFLLALPLERVFAVCAVCALSMPLGLNTIIIPAAYGKDTRVAAGMALVSHVLSCISIPLVFMLFEKIV